MSTTASNLSTQAEGKEKEEHQKNPAVAHDTNAQEASSSQQSRLKVKKGHFVSFVITFQAEPPKYGLHVLKTAREKSKLDDKNALSQIVDYGVWKAIICLERTTNSAIEIPGENWRYELEPYICRVLGVVYLERTNRSIDGGIHYSYWHEGCRLCDGPHVAHVLTDVVPQACGPLLAHTGIFYRYREDSKPRREHPASPGLMLPDYLSWQQVTGIEPANQDKPAANSDLYDKMEAINFYMLSHEILYAASYDSVFAPDHHKQDDPIIWQYTGEEERLRLRKLAEMAYMPGYEEQGFSKFVEAYHTE